MEIRAPWTRQQVIALNRFQQDGTFHPFTCGNPHPHSSPVLVAEEDGWFCPERTCGYRQNWAHGFMADLQPPMQRITAETLLAEIADALQRQAHDASVYGVAAVAVRVCVGLGLLPPEQ